MEQKPPNDGRAFKRPSTSNNSMQQCEMEKRRKIKRTADEIFGEIQDIIDNTPSCSKTNVVAMIAEPLMLRYDEELAEALSDEAKSSSNDKNPDSCPSAARQDVSTDMDIDEDKPDRDAARNGPKSDFTGTCIGKSFLNSRF
ncbi:uncharacterized protein LOC111079580 [Drosophila obscura]|uniref:uncharacterized protein LOC111079580 n=1 Tax=Drosophila obscura TaxID=7282 RepID=UPI000BA02202|nr:uncharacterized protein LOC111079580 [Drosophila obscura]